MKLTREERLKRYQDEKQRAAKLWINPIPGLALGKEEKFKLQNQFKTWAVHFQRDLLETGLDGLIEQYRRVVCHIQTQTCSHTKDGLVNTGDDFIYCCGISYEYFNDISVRKALQIIMDNVNEGLKSTIMLLIRDIDQELQDLIIKNPENENPCFDESFNWWSKYLPFGVKP